MSKSEESAKKNKVVASVAVFNPEGKMLWGVRNDTKKHTMPGGHLEGNESPAKGAVRELFEEAGLIPDELHSLGHDTVDSYDGKHKITVHAFKAICGGEPHSKNDPDKECEKWDWVDVKNNKVPEEILANLHSPKNVTLKLLGMQDWDGLSKSEKGFSYHTTTYSALPNIANEGISPSLDSVTMKGSPVVFFTHHPADAYRYFIDRPEPVLLRFPTPSHKCGSVEECMTPSRIHSQGIEAYVGDELSGLEDSYYDTDVESRFATLDSVGRLDLTDPSKWKPLSEVVSNEFGKSEDLTKMAIADLSLGKPTSESATSSRHDYSHMLPESLQGYRLDLVHRKNPAQNVPDLSAYLYHNNRQVGEVRGIVDGNKIDVHADLQPEHQNKRVGKAMYNAVLTHAYKALGVQGVKGHRLTQAAHRTQESLARDHGFDYKPRVIGAVTSEAGPTPTLYDHPGYAIKSEQEVNLLNVLSKAEKLLDLLKSDKIHSTSDSTVMDINKAPAHHLDSEYYRITPKVASAYEQYGRGGAVKNAQYISDPEPSIGGGVVTGYDNPEDLHHYIKNTYEPFLTGKVLPQSPDKPVVFLAPVPIRSMHHGNHSPYLTIDHLHGVAVATDKRGRVPFYYSIAKKNLEQGHPHPMVAPLIVNYEAKPNDSHQLSVVDGNGRSVSARTAGATHMLAYVQMKHDAVPHFLKMLHDTANNPEGRVRNIMNAPNLPSEFHVHQIPQLLDNVQKSEIIEKFDNLLKHLI